MRWNNSGIRGEDVKKVKETLEFVSKYSENLAFSAFCGNFLISRACRKSIICHQNKLITKEIVDYCEIIVSNTAKM